MSFFFSQKMCYIYKKKHPLLIFSVVCKVTVPLCSILFVLLAVKSNYFVIGDIFDHSKTKGFCGKREEFLERIGRDFGQ